MAHDADLTVSLDRSSRIGLPLQIVAGIRAEIATGRLRPGDSLPSSRVLAAQLGVARGTVQTAYEHLIAEGQLVTAARSGTRVNPALQTAPTGGGSPARAPTGRASAARRSGTHAAPVRAAPAQHSTDTSAEVRIDARGVSVRPDPRDEPDFRAAWRRGLDTRDVSDDGCGTQTVRQAIAGHLRLVRGMQVEPADIVLTAGARDGLRTVLNVLAPMALGVESPGFPGLRRALANTPTVDVPVDADGIDPAAIPVRLRALLVTPNHLHPHGDSMSATRRVQLLRWAESCGGHLIEDDYDTEARYAGSLPPTLADLDSSGRVLHLGSFATLLGTRLGIGYIIATGPLSAAIAAHRRMLGPAASPLIQAVLADYLDSGGLRRRMLRMRKRLAAAAEAVDAAGLPLTQVRGRVILERPAGDARRLRRALGERGILVDDLAGKWTGGQQTGIEIALSSLTGPELSTVLAAVRDELSRH
ncbi:PLP-dependent aminotransferase family protein [Brevibacterium luteolum]|uniref:aminotransferase-like domain-containing protein n=1 Tax=Brevibacterium luteolum TaxID=199591 RepID=UPI003B67071E